MVSFEKRFLTNPIDILENVYKKPLANRYLASFAIFLAENRGHYMIENIIEDGLNDFFLHISISTKKAGPSRLILLEVLHTDLKMFYKNFAILMN